MEKFNLENALAKLEEISGKLEKPDIPLQESIHLYEEGLEIIKKCNQVIKNAESKLTVLDENEMDSELNNENDDLTE